MGIIQRITGSRPIDITSPYTVGTVTQRINDATAGITIHRWWTNKLPSEPEWIIGGEVSDGQVRLTVARQPTRNSWRPALVGTLVSDGSGSRFVGTLGLSPEYKLFGIALLGANLAFLFSGLLAAGTLWFLLLTVWTGFVVTRTGMEMDYLRAWLVDTLNRPNPWDVPVPVPPVQLPPAQLPPALAPPAPKVVKVPRPRIPEPEPAPQVD